MRTGPMRHRVQVQNPSMTVDGVGQRTASYSTAITLWARIEPSRGEELQNANQTKGRITHKITTRYASQITTTSRLVYSSRNFEVVQVLNRLEKDEQLEILAREMV